MNDTVHELAEAASAGDGPPIPRPDWQPSGAVEEFSAGEAGRVAFSASSARFDYLLLGEPRTLAAGRYRIQLRGSVEAGASVFGVLDVRASRWLLTFHCPSAGLNESDLVVDRETLVQPIISAGNALGPGPVTGTVDSLSIVRTGDAPAVGEGRHAASLLAEDDALLCFVHIQNTAGTSVTDTLRRTYADSLRVFGGMTVRRDENGQAKTFRSPDADIQNVIREVRDRGQSLKIIAGHLPYGIHDRIGRRVRYISFLREPLDRLVSLYHNAMDAPRNSVLHRTMRSYDMDFRRAIEDGAAPQLSNEQTRMLIGSSKLFMDESDLETAKTVIERDYVLVGTNEQLDECLAWLAGALQLHDRFVAKLNVGTRQARPDADILRLFEEANAIDVKLYDWVSKRYLPRLLG